jgi:YD repeat-containing protein
MGRSVFEYDQAEGGVTSRNYVFGEFRTLLRYEYDEQERVISKTYSDINGRATSDTVYTFDPRGNLIEKKQTRPSGHSIVLQCAYDARDRLISSVEQRALNSEILTTNQQRFDYADDKVIQTSCLSHDLSECWKSTVLTYAENGAQETINYRRNGSVISKASYTADGQLMRQDSEMALVGNQGFVVTLEHDAFGNWVEKRFDCGAPYAKKSAMKPCETTYRDITYYEDVAPRGTENIDNDSLTYLLMGRGSMHRPQPLPFVPKP